MTTMKRMLPVTVSLAMLGGSPVMAEQMQITTTATRTTSKGASANFTGAVAVAPLFPANEHTHATGGLVTFEPGARSAWHTHPAGQVLIVTAGTGWVQEEGGGKREVRPGDVIWTPPGLKHWHGATATSGMSHIAVSNMKDGKNVDWMEQVSDTQYRE
jgi:quercetin dioxygenase-like cupin family protein